MKYFVHLCCAVALSGVTFSQSLQLTEFEKDIRISTPDMEWHDFKMGVQNISGSTVRTRVKVDKSGLLEGHRVKFCFAQECYDEDVTVSTAKGGASVLGPGMSDTSTFIGDFRADKTDGISVANFAFFNDANPSDEVKIVMRLLVAQSTSVDERDLSAQFSSNPVPASDRLTLKLPNPANAIRSLRIVDVHGRQLQAFEFNADALTFDCSSLPSGSYAALVGSSDGSFAQLRFVVAH